MFYNGLVFMEELAMGNNQEYTLVLSQTDAEREEIARVIDESIERHSKRIREEALQFARKINYARFAA